VVAVVEDLACGVDEAAEFGLLGDDAGEVGGVDGGGDGLGEREEVVRAADGVENPAVFQEFGELDEVAAVAGVVDVDDGLVDLAVGLAVEIGCASDDAQDVGDDVGVEDEGAQERHLRLWAGGGLPLEERLGRDRGSAFASCWEIPGHEG